LLVPDLFGFAKDVCMPHFLLRLLTYVTHYLCFPLRSFCANLLKTNPMYNFLNVKWKCLWTQNNLQFLDYRRYRCTNIGC